MVDGNQVGAVRTVPGIGDEMSYTPIEHRWEDGAFEKRALAQFNAIEQALVRPVRQHLFDDTAYISEPLCTVRRIGLALCQGDPERLSYIASTLTVTDMRLILGMKHKYTLGQLTTLLHRSTDEVIKRAHDIATDLSPSVLYEDYQS